METITKTKTKTKLLLATAALAAAGGLAFILYPSLNTSLTSNTLTQTSPTYTCSDSDGGNKPFVKGTVELADQFGNKQSATDICSLAIVGLSEKICGTKKSCANKTCTSYTFTPIISSTPTTCTYGCSAGACLPQPTCTDANWSYTLSPSPCPLSETQTKTWTKTGNCTSGVTHPSTESVTCTYVPPINGACGSANGSTVPTAPTTNLCSAGTASAVAGSGPWTWNCTGTNGGTTDNCSAQQTPLVCADSDGGNKTNIKGTASLQDPADGYKIITSSTDYCLLSNQLVEFNCKTSSTLEGSLASCTQGCVSGACFSSPF